MNSTSLSDLAVVPFTSTAVRSIRTSLDKSRSTSRGMYQPDARYYTGPAMAPLQTKYPIRRHCHLGTQRSPATAAAAAPGDEALCTTRSQTIAGACRCNNAAALYYSPAREQYNSTLNESTNQRALYATSLRIRERSPSGDTGA
jgi:hypothetical protein